MNFQKNLINNPGKYELDLQTYLVDYDSYNNFIHVPNTINASSINSFLKSIQVIYELEDTHANGYILDLSKIKKINVLGMLMIYKVIEYSVIKKCFNLPAIQFQDYITNKISEYGFSPLINAYVNNLNRDERLKKLEIKITDKFILAPQPLLRDSNFTNEYLREKFLPKLHEYYTGQEKIISMISICFSEILLNFWEHAVEDTQSIMIANGNDNFIEIACADSGNGILSTLKTNERYSDFDDLKLFSSCVKKNVTSKEKSNHMGFGLWILDELVKAANGRLHIYSEGYQYINDYNKIRIEKCSFWRGTIVYLALPLKNAKSLIDIEVFRKYRNNEINSKIKINYVDDDLS